MRHRPAMWEQAVQARCAALRDQLRTAEEFAAQLRAARQAADAKEKSRK